MKVGLANVTISVKMSVNVNLTFASKVLFQTEFFEREEKRVFGRNEIREIFFSPSTRERENMKNRLSLKLVPLNQIPTEN